MFDLTPALEALEKCLTQKANRYWNTIKIGRTHLQDATPIRLGQEISGWAAQVKLSHERLTWAALQGLSALPIGGTAVGTGINTHPEFGERMAVRLAEPTGIPFSEAEKPLRGPGRQGRRLQRQR